MGGKRGRAVLTALLTFFVCLPSPAWGVVSLRPDLRVEGFLRSQNALRTPQFQGMAWVMQRNTLQLEGAWDFLQEGKLLGGLSLGPLKEGTAVLIYRGVYDSIYDARVSFRRRFSSDEREDLRFENNIREAYVDLKAPPFSFRLGRQQVVWGETDFFRALDIVNPLDLTWHFFYELEWEDIRIPLWMIRGIYEVGSVGPFTDVFLEALWIPGDVRKTRISLDPRRPWGIRVLVPNTAFLPGEGLADLTIQRRERLPDRRVENSEFGARLKGFVGGVDVSLNYLYAFSDDAGSKIRTDLTEIGPPLSAGAAAHLILPLDLVFPRGHMVGLSANYSEERLTQTVFRVEATYTTGIPVSLREGVPLRLDRDRNLFQKTQKTVLMIAFDRPTWIRLLNPTRTFFLTGQFFWRRFIDFNRFMRGLPSVQEFSPGRFVGTNTDRLTEDELLMSLSASTTYGHAGEWQPFLAAFYDPPSTTGVTIFRLDYRLSDYIILRLDENYWWGGPYEEPWFIGGRFGRPRDDRTETILTVIFQF